MTCIVGIEDGDRVVIGADSAAAMGWSIGTRADAKAWAEGSYRMAFGYTSSFRMGQLLRHRLRIPIDKTPSPTMLADADKLDGWMATQFIDRVRQVLRKGGYTKVEHEREEGGAFLVGVGAHLYGVDSDFQIGRYARGEYAVGCGADIALGALYGIKAADVGHGRSVMRAEDRVHLALKAAAEWSNGVRGPFTIVDTKGGEELRDA